MSGPPLCCFKSLFITAPSGSRRPDHFLLVQQLTQISRIILLDVTRMRPLDCHKNLRSHTKSWDFWQEASLRRYDTLTRSLSWRFPRRRLSLFRGMSVVTDNPRTRAAYGGVRERRGLARLWVASAVMFHPSTAGAGGCFAFQEADIIKA